jgi:hypothetical protein
MPTNRRYVRHARRGRLNHAEEMTLIYGPDPRWDAFDTDEEARTAWAQHRDRLLAGYRHGRRPMAWWTLESPVAFPGYEHQQATLFEANLLEPEERAELERWWHEQFERAQAVDFWFTVRPGVILTGEPARKAHYRWADIPASLRKEWTAQRKRRGRTIDRLAKAVTEAAAVDEPVAG